MYYNTISEAKKAYKEAYNWCVKVQRACILKPVYISIDVQYCEPNFRESDIDAWSLDIKIWDAETKTHVTAEWTAWDEPGKFEESKKAILAYLESKGITLK